MVQEFVQSACFAGLWNDFLHHSVIDDALFVGFASFEVAILFMKYLCGCKMADSECR